MPAINERVEYWSPFSGGPYPAIVTKINEDGTVALALVGNENVADPILTLRSVPYGIGQQARPVAPGCAEMANG